MKVGDVFDLVTPLVLLSLYWLMYQLDGNRAIGQKGSLIFIVFTAFWAAGQGMHLSANSIGHLLEDVKGSDVSNLTNFYDEVLSHYLWHFGVLGVLMYRQRQNPLIEGGTAP